MIALKHFHVGFWFLSPKMEAQSTEHEEHGTCVGIGLDIEGISMLLGIGKELVGPKLVGVGMVLVGTELVGPNIVLAKVGTVMKMGAVLSRHGMVLAGLGGVIIRLSMLWLELWYDWDFAWYWSPSAVNMVLA